MPEAQSSLRRALMAALLVWCGMGYAHAAPDEELLGKDRGYPVGTPATWFTDERVRVGSFSQLDSILPHRRLLRADRPRALPIAAITPEYTYTGRTIDDFLARRRVTGLMVIKDGVVQLERYQYGRTPEHRLTSNSMAKSITSIAVGLALQEGASVETIVLGFVVRGATGQALSDYVSDRLWRPMSAEADATWIVDAGGVEYAWGQFNASLRDWGRLAMLLADDDARDSKQIIPRDYLLEATDAKRHPAAFAPWTATPYYGYGYQFWTFPSGSRRFALLGAYGQSIFVDPQLRLALIITAAQPDPLSINDGFGAERTRLWRGIVERYGTW